MASGGATPALSKRPQDSDFYQQRLKAWQPILTPKWVVIIFLCIGIPFIIIGILLKNASDGVVEYKKQYDGAGTDAALQALCVATPTPRSSASPLPSPGSSCRVTFTTTATMKAPVFVYYELTNFYQNHRRYVKSRSDNQLQGQLITNANLLADCDPLRKAGDKILSPCGLIANSYFNDTIKLRGTSVTMDETNISWESDRRKFKDVSDAQKNESSATITFINETYPGVGSITNEHFIVWMRVAALPTFRKLYGRIDKEIPANTMLEFDVSSVFPVSSFSGTKSLVISTVSALGGKNDFLGIAYIVVGASCIGLAALFAARSYFGGRRLGDTAFLVWNARR